MSAVVDGTGSLVSASVEEVVVAVSVERATQTLSDDL